MSSTDNLPRPADSPCLKCASAGCTSITVGKGGDRKTFPVDRPWYACQIAYPDEIVGNIYDDPDLLK